MGCTDSAGDSRWYLPRCATEGCTWDVNQEGDYCWAHRAEQPCDRCGLIEACMCGEPSLTT
jgi:hypothetical protein